LSMPRHMENKDWGQNLTVRDLNLREAKFLSTKTTCAEAVAEIQKGCTSFPVRDESGKVVGVLTSVNLMTRIGKAQVEMGDSIMRAVVRDIRNVSLTVSLNELTRILARNRFVLVSEKYMVTIDDVINKMCPPKPKVVSITKADTDAAQGSSSTSKFLLGAMLGATFAMGAMVAFQKISKQ